MEESLVDSESGKLMLLRAFLKSSRISHCAWGDPWKKVVSGYSKPRRWCLLHNFKVSNLSISGFLYITCDKHIYIYLIGGFNPSEKYVRQLGLLYPTERKNKIHVPSHQPNIYIYNIYIYQTSLKKGFTHYDVIGHVRTWPLISMNLPDFWGSPMKAENSETDHGYSLNMSIIYWI